MYYCSAAIFLCLHTFSISRQLLEISAPASELQTAHRHASKSPPTFQNKNRRIIHCLEFFNVGINNKLSPLEIVCVGNPIYYLNLNMPGFLDTSWNAFEARNPCWRGLGWVDKLGQTLCSGLQTRAN